MVKFLDYPIRTKTVEGPSECCSRKQPLGTQRFRQVTEDSDFWFRNKSLDAHRKWANSAQDLVPLLENHKRLAAELLQRIDAPEIAMELFKEDDYITRSFAAQSLAKMRTYTSNSQRTSTTQSELLLLKIQ